MEQYDERTWFSPETGDQVSLTYIDLVPDLPAPLDNVPLLRHRLAVETADVGALIEAHVLSIDNVLSLYQLLKLPIPDRDSGQAFIAAFTVPKATCSVVLRIQCAEGDPTGLRESAVIAQVGPEAFVRPHPYAPALEGRLPWHVGDEERWDGRFPDHPLSRARAWAKRTMATARIDPSFASLPPFTAGGPGPNDHTDYHQPVERPALGPSRKEQARRANGRRPEPPARPDPPLDVPDLSRSEPSDSAPAPRPPAPPIPPPPSQLPVRQARRSTMDKASAWQPPPPDPEPPAPPPSPSAPSSPPPPSSLPSSSPSSTSSSSSSETIGARASRGRRAAADDANARGSTHRMAQPEEPKPETLKGPTVAAADLRPAPDGVTGDSQGKATSDSVDLKVPPLEAPRSGDATPSTPPVFPTGDPDVEDAARTQQVSQEEIARSTSDSTTHRMPGALPGFPGAAPEAGNGRQPGFPGAGPDPQGPNGTPGDGRQPTFPAAGLDSPAPPGGGNGRFPGAGPDPQGPGAGNGRRPGFPGAGPEGRPGGNGFPGGGPDPQGQPGFPNATPDNGRQPAFPDAGNGRRSGFGSDPQAPAGPTPDNGRQPAFPGAGPEPGSRLPGIPDPASARRVTPDNYPVAGASGTFPAVSPESSAIPALSGDSGGGFTDFGPSGTGVFPVVPPGLGAFPDLSAPAGALSPASSAFPEDSPPSGAFTGISPPSGAFPGLSPGSSVIPGNDVTRPANTPLNGGNGRPGIPEPRPFPNGGPGNGRPPVAEIPPATPSPPTGLSRPFDLPSPPSRLPSVPPGTVLPETPEPPAGDPTDIASLPSRVPSLPPGTVRPAGGPNQPGVPSPPGGIPNQPGMPSPPGGVPSPPGIPLAGAMNPLGTPNTGANPIAPNPLDPQNPLGAPNRPSAPGGLPNPAGAMGPGGAPGMAGGPNAGGAPNPGGLPNRGGQPNPAGAMGPGGAPNAGGLPNPGGTPGPAGAPNAGLPNGGLASPAALGPGAGGMDGRTSPAGPPSPPAGLSPATAARVFPDDLRPASFAEIAPASSPFPAVPPSPAELNRSGMFPPIPGSPNASNTRMPPAFTDNSQLSTDVQRAYSTPPPSAVGRPVGLPRAYPSGMPQPIGSGQAAGLQPGRQIAPPVPFPGEPGGEPGDVMHTVLMGLPIGGILPLWHEDSITFWRMPDPSGIRSRLGVGIESRTEIDNRRFREAALFAPGRNTLFMMDRNRNGHGNLGGASAQLLPATEEEAYRAADDKALSDLYSWIGDLVVAAGQRGEYVAIETGGWQVPLTPVVLIMLRTDGREWHSVVETSPVPLGAPVWRDQQPVAGDTQLLASPATERTMRAAGLLTRFAVATWRLHPFQLGLSFGPNPTLGDVATR
jgi:hypothetical protein